MVGERGFSDITWLGQNLGKVRREECRCGKGEAKNKRGKKGLFTFSR